MASPRKNAKLSYKDDEETKRGPTLRPDEMPPDVIEFITAIDEYKRIQQRPFPTWSEVLDVVKSLGYQRSEK